MEKLTLEQKIGQILMIGWQTDHAKDIVELIKKYHFGNFILFTRNIRSARHLKELTSEIQAAALKCNGVPAFIAIDQEGGNVRRVYQGVTNIPGHMAIGAASFSRPKSASEIGHIVGRELKNSGINFILSPIVDVNTNPQNPIIGIRSFSDDPWMVSRLAEQMSSAIQEEGVLSCYKHFIGHGDVHIDSHLDLPYLDKSLDALKQTELVPYSSSYRPDAIMTAHILYRDLDERFPATVSKKIIHELLRKELGYEGIVITDCFEMDALSRAFSLGGAAIFALEASCDIITISHSFGRQIVVRNALLDALTTKTMDVNILDQAVERVLKYKEKYCYDHLVSIDYNQNKEIAESVSLASVTIASGKPFEIDSSCVVVGVTNYVNSVAEDKNVENMDVAKIIGENFSIPYYSIDNKNFSITDILTFTKDKKVILALSDSHLTLVQKVLYVNLIQANTRIMLISLRTPYDVLEQELPECHICLYEYTKLSINSLIKVLEGEEAKGVLPVKIGKVKKEYNDYRNYLIDNIILYIDENFAKPLTLEAVASEFLISSGHLCRLFKQKLDINFINYLHQVRIKKAKQLLLTSNLRIYEIAYFCGYQDINYFTKVFKKYTGLTPIYYRNNSSYYD